MRSPVTEELLARVASRVAVKRYDGRETDELEVFEREEIERDVEQVLQALFREPGATLIIAPPNHPVIQIQEV